MSEISKMNYQQLDGYVWMTREEFERFMNDISTMDRELSRLREKIANMPDDLY